VFGPPARPPMPAERAVYKLAGLGAYGVSFHDNDVFAFEATAAERDERIAAFRRALAETGLVVTTATTNLFAHPVFRDGGFTASDRDIRRHQPARQHGAPVRLHRGDGTRRGRTAIAPAHYDDAVRPGRRGVRAAPSVLTGGLTRPKGA
jgi:hypothetical protein